MKKMTAVVALMAVFTLAMCFIVIGAISVELMAKLGIGPGEIGSMVFALFLTATITELFIGPLVDKLGHKPIAIVGFAVVAASMFLLAFAPSFNLAMLAAILLGVGAMCCNTVGNTLIPVVLFEGTDPARAGNFGNGFFGMGLVVVPWLVSGLNTLGMASSTALAILGGLVIVFLLFALTASYPQVSTGFKLSMAFKLLAEGAVLLAALALFCYIALENTMSTWLKPYLNEIFGNADTAGFILGFFGLSMMAGRFIVSAIKNLTDIGVKLIVGSALVALVAILLMILNPSPVIAVIAVVAIGLTFAPIFPTIVGVTFAKYEPQLYGSIFGIIFSIGLLGGTFVPKYVGDLAAGKSVQESLWITVVMSGILVVLAVLMSVVGKKKA